MGLMTLLQVIRIGLFCIIFYAYLHICWRSHIFKFLHQCFFLFFVFFILFPTFHFPLFCFYRSFWSYYSLVLPRRAPFDHTRKLAANETAAIRRIEKALVQHWQTSTANEAKLLLFPAESQCSDTQRTTLSTNIRSQWPDGRDLLHQQTIIFCFTNEVSNEIVR